MVFLSLSLSIFVVFFKKFANFLNAGLALQSPFWADLFLWLSRENYKKHTTANKIFFRTE